MSVGYTMDHSSTIRAPSFVYSENISSINNGANPAVFLNNNMTSVPLNADIIVNELNEGTRLDMWFTFLLKNVSQITPSHQELLAELFNFYWFKDYSNEIVSLYIELLAHLNSAHSNTYIKESYESLVKPLRGILMSGVPLDDEEIVNTQKDFTEVFTSIHTAIKKLLWISPSSATILSKVISDLFPHKVFNVEAQKTYLANILKIADYYPPLKEHIFLLVVDKILQIDVDIKVDNPNNKNEEDNYHPIFEAEINQESQESAELCEKIDSLLLIIFEYLSKQSIEEGKETFSSLRKAFDRLILHTHKPKYTQFLLFYHCRVHQDFVNEYLDYLFTTMENDRISTLCRLNCILYIGSFVARAKFVPEVTAQRTLSMFIEWMHQYITTNEGAKPNTEYHKPFYYMFQATCYLLVHAHEKIFGNVEKTILKELDIERIAYSSLNPMKICFPPLMRDFVRVVANYGVKLSNILDMNEKLMYATGVVFSELYFPFDPYFLSKSSQYITEIYNSNVNVLESGYLTEGETECEYEENETFDEDIYKSPKFGSYASSNMMQMLGSSLPSSGVLGSSFQSLGFSIDDDHNKSPFRM